jgi:hypothetical protein
MCLQAPEEKARGITIATAHGERTVPCPVLVALLTLIAELTLPSSSIKL